MSPSIVRLQPSLEMEMSTSVFKKATNAGKYSNKLKEEIKENY